MNDDKCYYNGDTLSNQPHGIGIITYTNNNNPEINHTGVWKNGNRHGLGTTNYRDGCRFVGHYQNNVKNGYGTYYYVNGVIYEGFWMNGKRCGDGILQLLNGVIINLRFQNDNQPDDMIVYESGLIYKGTVNNNGERHGIGTLIYLDGSCYQGQFMNNKRHGTGKYTSSFIMGSSLLGEYFNDNFMCRLDDNHTNFANCDNILKMKRVRFACNK